MEKLYDQSFENLIREGAFDFNYLDGIGFNPYWPYKSNPPTDFTSAGLSDLEQLVEIIGDYPGIYSLRVVGSACVGLARAFPYSVRKIREDNYYILLRDSGPPQSDIDVELLIDWEKLSELVRTIEETERKGVIDRRTERGSINLAFYPYLEIITLIRNPYSSVLQRYAVWSNTTIVFLGLDRIKELRDLSRETINNSSPEEQKWFWGNLADRYLFHQRRLSIKRGERSEIIITAEEAPTLFDPKFRLQPRTKHTYSF